MTSILSEYLSRFRNHSYEELVRFVKSSQVEKFEIMNTKSNKYQIEINFFWEDKPNGDVRAIGSIDENPHRPVFHNIAILRWISIYVSSVMDSFIKNSAGKIITY